MSRTSSSSSARSQPKISLSLLSAMAHFVSLKLLALAVSIAFLASGSVTSQTIYPDAFLCTLQVECNTYVTPQECLSFLQEFKWPLTSFRVEGPVVPLTRPAPTLSTGMISYVLFNAHYTSNWTVEVDYNVPNQLGFSLRAWWIKSPDEISQGILPMVAPAEKFRVIASPAERLPCPGAAANANCTMAYFPVVISYLGGGLEATTPLSA